MKNKIQFVSLTVVAFCGGNWKMCYLYLLQLIDVLSLLDVQL